MKTKITNRTEYAKATGYDVTLDVTYRRVRKVRAMDPEQANEFAMAREMDYASRYYYSTSHIDYQVKDIEAVAVAPASLRLGKGDDSDGGDLVHDDDGKKKAQSGKGVRGSGARK